MPHWKSQISLGMEEGELDQWNGHCAMQASAIIKNWRTRAWITLVNFRISIQKVSYTVEVICIREDIKLFQEIIVVMSN